MNNDTDAALLKKIGDLIAEEQAIYDRGMSGDNDRARLDEIHVELDRHWDLLRQRRGREEFGKNPDDATMRPASVVENYEQ